VSGPPEAAVTARPEETEMRERRSALLMAAEKAPARSARLVAAANADPQVGALERNLEQPV